MNWKLKFFFCCLVLHLEQIPASELRTDLPELFRKYYALRPSRGDYFLQYDKGSGAADYYIRDAFGSSEFVLRMREELTVYDLEPNQDIEMCNGTVTDSDTGRTGVTYGSIDKNTEIFRGQFVLGEVTYYVEDAEDFMPNPPADVVSIAYSSEDVVLKNLPYESKLMMAPDFDPSDPTSGSRDTAGLSSDEPKETSQYTARDSDSICELDIRIDNGVYSDNGRDFNKIRNKIYQMVMSANRIYQSTFLRSGKPAVKFTVGRLAVATDEFCSRYRNNIHCSRRVDGPEDFLNVFSRQNAQKYCLSYMMTNRNFGSTLGVAFVGGLCDARDRVSYNTGFVVTSAATSQFSTDLTFAHEVGHNFGSSHDQRGDCLGDSQNGSFLMSPFSPRVRKPNNDNFSRCSRNDIVSLLRAIFSNRRKNCFVAERGSLVEPTFSAQTAEENGVDGNSVRGGVVDPLVAGSDAASSVVGSAASVVILSVVAAVVGKF